MDLFSCIVPEAGDGSVVGSLNKTSFQCQPSTERNGEAFIPSIPDLYFNHSNVATLRSDGALNSTTVVEDHLTYIIPIPAESAERNCSGPVTAIDYCYKIDRNSTGVSTNIFNFVVFSRNASHISVETRIRIRSRPQFDICTALGGPEDEDMICCDRFNGGIRRMLFLPSSTYTIGVVSREVELLTLEDAESVDRTDVEKFQVSLGNSGSPGTTVALSDLEQSSRQPNLLLRMAVGKFIGGSVLIFAV